MAMYVTKRDVLENLRLPLKGSLDLTYRCNNNCRHCWLWLPVNAAEKAEELSFGEIRTIVDEARALGTREWDISGGEAMIRPDFAEIFDYITRHSRFYTLRTNGTLVTPQIARLMRRPGAKWISLYGATADVYDRVTRNPGAFESLMRTFALLKENSVPFTVQLFPLRDNWHQWPQMIELARSISPEWRIGAAWLHLSASGDPVRNDEIRRQRLDPADVIALDPPFIDGSSDMRDNRECQVHKTESGLFAACIESGDRIHIDPYGQMSFCEIIKDPALRYNLRHGSVKEGWDVFLPSLAEKVLGSNVYKNGCGHCALKEDCRWCASYAWIEHRDFSEKINYLCNIAEENRRYKNNWQTHNRRYYQAAGITIQIDSDKAITESTFTPAVQTFAVDGPGEDTVRIHHHFSLDGVALHDLGNEIYHVAPWTVYRKDASWIYLCSLGDTIYSVSVFNADQSRGRIYHANDEFWEKGRLNTITVPVTDQILLVRLLAERQALILHSAGAILDEKGLLFVGHSDAGKTTTTRLFEGHAEILCDDRNIVRLQGDTFDVYGTWSHGDSALVSAASAPLKAIFLIRQSPDNRLTRLTRKTAFNKLLPCVVRGYADVEWWNKTLTLVERLTHDIPCYEMEFDQTGGIVPLVQSLCS